MKKTVTTIIMFVVSCALLAQSASQNYVLTQKLLNASGSNKVTEVQYHDGLGRLEIHVTTGLGISGNSILRLPRYSE